MDSTSCDRTSISLKEEMFVRLFVCVFVIYSLKTAEQVLLPGDIASELEIPPKHFDFV